MRFVHGRVRGAGGCAHAFCMAGAAARAMLAVLAMLTACVGLIMFMFMLPASGEGPSHLEVPLFKGESKAPARE